MQMKNKNVLSIKFETPPIIDAFSHKDMNKGKFGKVQ